MFLLAEGLVTVHERLQFSRMFLPPANRRKLITDNPFEEITHPAVMLPDRQVSSPVAKPSECLRGLIDLEDDRRALPRRRPTVSEQGPVGALAGREPGIGADRKPIAQDRAPPARTAGLSRCSQS